MAFSLSCHEKTDKTGEDKLLVDIQVDEGLTNKVDELLLSDVAQDIDIIPLETRKESVIGYVFNMAVGEDDIILNELNRVSRFSKHDGKFINNIGEFGTGPSDFYYCGGVGLNEDRQYVYLFTSPEIKTYDLNGKFLSTVKIAKPGTQWDAEANPGADTRTYLYFNGKHVIRRMLPTFDDSKSLWQLGMTDTTGRYIAKYSEPACVAYEEGMNRNNSGGKGFEPEQVRYFWGANSPVINRYYNHVNCLFDSNDTIYRYSEKESRLTPRYILRCGTRPTFQEMHVMGKSYDYFHHAFVKDVLETKDYMFLITEKDRSSFLQRVDKKTGAIVSIENVGELKESSLMKVIQRKVKQPGFTNDLCGGLPFFPRNQNDRQWVALYEAADLLEQVDIDELKKTDVILPEKREQLIRMLKNMKEDDNPVVMVVTLK